MTNWTFLQQTRYKRVFLCLDPVQYGSTHEREHMVATDITVTLTPEQHGLILDMFSTIADLGLYDAYEEREQDSCPDLFDKTWDQVIAAK